MRRVDGESSPSNDPYRERHPLIKVGRSTRCEPPIRLAPMLGASLARPPLKDAARGLCGTVSPVAAFVAAAVFAIGCGEERRNTAPAATSSPQANRGSASEALSVQQALNVDRRGPMTVRGWLVIDRGDAELCDLILDSLPPQCGPVALRVKINEDVLEPLDLRARRRHVE